jgi:alpha-1,3-rhamnosyl/mannosyltransferase
MHVGLEATVALAHSFTGAQRYVLELSHGLAALDAPDLRCSLLLRLTSFRKRRLLPASPWPNRWYYSGPWPAVPRCDVLHGLNVRLPHTGGRAARVATIHDLSPFSLPNYGSERTLQRLREGYRYAAARADRIIAISAATKADFVHYLGFPAERIDVVHHGVSATFLAPAEPGTAPAREPRYFVAFGGTPRKNLPRVIRALAVSNARGLQLRIVGPIDGDVAQAITETRLASRVQQEQNLNEPQLRGLYARSSGLLYPSLLEGFGLPILEAMASGVPVLTSVSGGTEEIAHGHAVLAEPESIESLAAGIDRLRDVGADSLAAAARYARTFSWRRTAEQTLAVYRATV